MNNLDVIIQEIADLEGQPLNYDRAEKLVLLYSLRDRYIKEPEKPTLSELPMGTSEFVQAIKNKPIDKVWALIDELVQSVQVLQPRLYDGFMEKIMEL